MVHRRELNGQALILGNQGALWGNAMTWFDHRTGSVWSQPLGEAIAGPLRGERLDLLPVSLTRWDTWVASHPGTLALAVDSQGRSRFRLEEVSIVVDFTDEVAAYPFPALIEAGVINDMVAGVPVAVVVDPTDDQSWRVFSRTLDGSVIELTIDGDLLIDPASGSRFDPDVGRAVDGPLEGLVLDPLPAFTSFPADVTTFWPDARIWEPTAPR